MITRTVLAADHPADMKVTPLITSDYSEISNYTINHQIVPTGVYRTLKEDMGFDQLRFYCFKKTVGRVFHIKTALNQLGEAVVQHFTVDSVNEENKPKACGSFKVYEDDTSVLSQDCSRWGQTSEGFRQDKWGGLNANGQRRMFTKLVFTEGSHCVQMGGFYSCDDPCLWKKCRSFSQAPLGRRHLEGFCAVKDWFSPDQSKSDRLELNIRRLR